MGPAPYEQNTSPIPKSTSGGSIATKEPLSLRTIVHIRPSVHTETMNVGKQFTTPLETSISTAAPSEKLRMAPLASLQSNFFPSNTHIKSSSHCPTTVARKKYHTNGKKETSSIIDLTRPRKTRIASKQVSEEDEESQWYSDRSNTRKQSLPKSHSDKTPPQLVTIQRQLASVETKLRQIDSKLDRVMQFQEHPMVIAGVAAAQTKKLDGILDLVNHVFDSVTNMEDQQGKHDITPVKNFSFYNH